MCIRDSIGGLRADLDYQGIAVHPRRSGFRFDIRMFYIACFEYAFCYMDSVGQCGIGIAGAKNGIFLLATEYAPPSGRARVAAVAITDASFDPPPHPYPDDFERHAIMFASVGRNFEASREPLGAIVDAVEERMVNVSAGHESHPATTHAATAAVFEFLRQGAAGRAAVANDELRVEDQLNHLPASVIGAVERKSFDGGLADT